MPQIDSQHFENEFGHLKRLKHENIVRLLGFCDESEPIIAQYGGRQVHCEVIHRALCLEYMPNGSLTKLLSEEYTGTNWSIRYKIIKGICEGLKYLHEGLEVPILHLDLKPDNILLDQGMVPKIADFGLSRLFGEENTIRTMSPLGTLGYWPPEFIDRGIISKKYDIFSLGVIIMKIIVGLEGYSSIADIDAGGCFDYVYNNSRPNYAFVEPDYERVRCCIEIAINCMDKDRRKRPRISDVVSKLDEIDFFSSLQQHPAVKEAEGSTVTMHIQEEWNNQVDTDKLVVIDFPATWCSMSRGMAPVFADTAKEFTNETVLSESDQFYSASQAIRKILEISYGDLPLPVKSCFLYLTAFSGNHMIKKDRLIRRWVAEGLIPERHGKSLLETGERYFVELINRRLIQPAFDNDDDQPTGCTVHGDVANFMASLSNEENFITPGAELNSGLFRQVSLDINYGYEHEGDTLFSDMCCLLEQKSWVVSCSDENSSGGINEAISLHLYRVQSIAFWAFKHVRVLDLEDTKGLENKQLESLGRLSLLRYLGLSRTDVTRLPPEIMALKQLTTLNLRQTRVRRLPRFGDMKLLSLLVDELIILGVMGGMQELEELSKVLLGPDGSLAGDVARLVTKLGRLRMLGVRFSHLLGLNETDRQGVKHFLEEVGKSNLQSLFLDNYHHQLLDLLAASSWAHNRPHHLRKFELRMHECLPLVPPEIASLRALTHLHIHVEAVEAEAVRALGYLPNLVLLKLRLSTSTGLAVGSKDGFHCLKVFSYHGALGLQFEEGAMPQLRRLCLDLDARDEMPELESLEFGIQHLTCLVQVRATIHCKDTLTASEVEAAEAHIRGQVSLNPNNRVFELNRRVQRSAAKAAEAPVIAIQSLDEWSSQVCPDKLVVVFFTASWCRPSHRMDPVFADLAKKNPNVVFLKVDVDVGEMSIIAKQLSVNGVPTFLFMREGTVKDRVLGADKEELEEKLLEQLSLMPWLRLYV
ncbi:uncharacterized protein LOC8067139 isoform X2 [Sorghum bicolor]|nr:uncharacterized protein LOC8067139 isoform X2 [Sorghum bicolor]|eukprot:XP_021302062.1 uncharacterized protein LOC8067139 isoform X2 [Sorghum bicolor]